MSMNSPRAFDRVLTIMFENQYRSYVMANPYFRGLARQGIDMGAYFGVMHPSQTNYIASIAGELCNVTDDTAPPALPQRTIVDLIEESPEGLSWKAYMDSYIPANNRWTEGGFTPKDEYPYVIKHNPFSSFSNIRNDKSRWERVANEAEFFKDVLNGSLPSYAWFTPDMWNDGHYLDGTHKEPEDRAPLLVDQAAAWLEGFFGALRFPGPASHLPANTLVVVTFDEADFEAKWEVGEKYTYDGPNQIYTVLLGDMIDPAVETGGYNHYSLIRTIEKNFGLSTLQKNDAHASWFQFLWRREFRWEAPQSTPIKAPLGLASTGFEEAVYAIGADESGLQLWTWAQDTWSEPRPLGIRGQEPAIATVGSVLHCMFRTEDGAIAWTPYTSEDGLGADPLVLSTEPAHGLAATAFGQDAEQLMAAWVTDTGEIVSRRYCDGAWQEAVATGFSTDGDLCLGAIGPSLYLVFKERGTDHLFAASYNAADYNVVEVPDGDYGGSYDNTSVHRWARNAFPVAHFSSAPFQGTPGEAEPLTEVYRAGGPLAIGILDGVLHLVHPGPGNGVLMEEQFSIAGVMTAALPVSYCASDAKTTSNGYGTLAEAGWTEQRPLHGTFLAADGKLCIASSPDALALLYQAPGGQTRMCRGLYRAVR